MDNNSLPPSSPQPFQPDYSGYQSQPLPPPKRSSASKFLLIVLVICVIALAAAFIFMPRKEKPSQQTEAPQGETVLITDINSQDDLSKLSTEQGKAFCRDVLKYKIESPEIKALNERLGYKSGDVDDVYFGCSLTIAEDDYVKKDKAGENDAMYREDASKYKTIANNFAFDTYDTTFSSGDLNLSKRVALNIEGEAKNLLMEYTTLHEGGFSPYSSRDAVRIQVFDKRDFPLVGNCGPNLMTLNAGVDSKAACTEASAVFEGQSVYKGKGITSDAYSVTVKNTRIVVEARNESEAFNVIKGMKKVSRDQLDFFIKD